MRRLRLIPKPNYLTECGQSMAELAVFGGLLLVVLSVMLRLGMTFQYRQVIQQEAFRKALASSQSVTVSHAEEGNFPAGEAIYEVVEDRLIPDPSDPLVLSSRSPVIAQSHVVLGNDLLYRTEEELKDIPNVIEINYSDRAGVGFRNVFRAREFDAGGDENLRLGLLTDTSHDVRQRVVFDRTEDHNQIRTTRRITPSDETGAPEEQLERTIATVGGELPPVVTEFSTPTPPRTWVTTHD